MANQISEGYILLTPIILKKYSRSDLQTLSNELERVAKELRGEQIPLDDLPAIQKKNRKLGRINQALMVVKNLLMEQQRHQKPQKHPKR